MGRRKQRNNKLERRGSLKERTQSDKEKVKG